MGVHQLWNILEPVRRKENLSTLSNKTLCVDLSGWICEAKCAKGLKENVNKPHLRNLFFRLLYLTRLGAKLVFVVDGKPPELKWKAITKRVQARNGGRNWKSKNTQSSASGARVGRSHFDFWVKECCTLLNLLGIPCIKSAGEAEALCAWLDLHQIVDGCITNDGDAFLYGARTVYRDLCISGKPVNADVFVVVASLHPKDLNRQNLVALGVLLGCDYLPHGVSGVGKEIAMKLIRNVKHDNLIDRFFKWAKGTCQDENLSSVEKSVKCKALKDKNFPHPEVIQEFLDPKVVPQKVSLKIMNPDLQGLQEFCLKNLEWPEEYTREKVLLLITYWQMTSSLQQSTETLVLPQRIVKARVQQKIECYEIEWQNVSLGETCSPTFVTIETRELFANVYPDLVEEFKNAEAAKLSKKSRKKKPDKPSKKTHDCEDEVNLLSQQLQDLSVQHSDRGTRHGSVAHEEPAKQEVDKDESLQDIIDSILPNTIDHDSSSPECSAECSSPYVGMIDRNFLAASKRWQEIDNDEDDDYDHVRNDDQDVNDDYEVDDIPCDYQPVRMVMAPKLGNKEFTKPDDYSSYPGVTDREDDFLKCGLSKLKDMKIRSGYTAEDVLDCSQDNNDTDDDSEDYDHERRVINVSKLPSPDIPPCRTTAAKPITHLEFVVLIDSSDEDIVVSGKERKVLKKNVRASKTKQVLLNDSDLQQIFGSSDLWSSDDDEEENANRDVESFALTRKASGINKTASSTAKLNYNHALGKPSASLCKKSTELDSCPSLSRQTKLEDCRDSPLVENGSQTVSNKDLQSNGLRNGPYVKTVSNSDNVYEARAERVKVKSAESISKRVLLPTNTNQSISGSPTTNVLSNGFLAIPQCDKLDDSNTRVSSKDGAQKGNVDSPAEKENVASPCDDSVPAPLFRRLRQNFTAKHRLASLRSISSATYE